MDNDSDRMSGALSDVYSDELPVHEPQGDSHSASGHITVDESSLSSEASGDRAERCVDTRCEYMTLNLKDYDKYGKSDGKLYECKKIRTKFLAGTICDWKVCEECYKTGLHHKHLEYMAELTDG